jgi:hypothetical protein
LKSLINFRESEGVVKNGPSREAINIGHTRHRTKTNKTKITKQKTKKEEIKSDLNPTTNRGETWCS